MTIQDIYNLLADGERVTLECKKAQNNVPNSLWDTYSAFANTNGGTILLGVYEDTQEKDMAKRFTITGVDDADKIRKDLWNTVNSREKVNVNLLDDEDIQTVESEGKSVIAITVPRAEVKLRPIYINNNPMRGTYRRNHEGDYHCNESMVKMMMRDAFDEGNDGMFLEYYTMNDIDEASLKGYRNMFSSRNPEHVWNSYDNKEFLMNLGGYVVNRKEKTEGLTMAGLLMFGKGLPVREKFDNLRMDYIDKTNLIGEQRYSDRLTYDGTWENNLFNFIRMVLPRLTRELPRPFKMQGIIRDDDTPQHKAVREAFTNMIIHGDLMMNGLLRVEKYDDVFVLTNPGLLKLPIEQIYAGGESKARNQRIQNMLRMIGYGENIGSGFPLILSAWNEKDWLKPELIEQSDLMQVKLVLHIESKEDINVPPMSPQCPPNVSKNIFSKLTERQKSIVELVCSIPTTTKADMSEKFAVVEKTIQRDLASIRESGIGLTYEDGKWIIKTKD